MFAHRQILTFVDIKKTPVEPIKADYLPRGSLKYEFGSELLQTPVQLLRISNAEAQACQKMLLHCQILLQLSLYVQTFMWEYFVP